jgi:hypothetical protein
MDRAGHAVSSKEGDGAAAPKLTFAGECGRQLLNLSKP